MAIFLTLVKVLLRMDPHPKEEGFKQKYKIHKTGSLIRWSKVVQAQKVIIRQMNQNTNPKTLASLTGEANR